MPRFLEDGSTQRLTESGVGRILETDPNVIDLAGNATVTFTAAGRILGPVNLTGGSGSITFTGTGALQRVADLAGTADVTVTASGSLLRIADLAGAATITFTAEGTLSRTQIGTWTSQPWTLDGIIGSSVITWDQTTPDDSTITAEVNVNGGGWVPISNGDSIPGASPGTTVDGWTLQVRLTLSRDDEHPTPTATNLVVEARPGSVDELVPLGVFSIASAQVSEHADSMTMTVNGWDRAWRVQRGRYVEPYVIPAGTNVATAIQDLLNDRAPGVFTAFRFSTTTATTPEIIFDAVPESDPWVDALNLAASAGMILYIDPLGIPVLELAPDPNHTPDAWVLSAGDNATLLSVDKDVSGERIYNGVIVVGESTSLDDNGDPIPPVRAEAWDDDPDSPTYRFGSFGQVPYFIVSSFITTEEQAETATAANLLRVLGATELVRASTVPLPHLDGDDVIVISSPGSRVNARYVIGRATVPLGLHEEMMVEARRRRVTPDGATIDEGD